MRQRLLVLCLALTMWVGAGFESAAWSQPDRMTGVGPSLLERPLRYVNNGPNPIFYNYTAWPIGGVYHHLGGGSIYAWWSGINPGSEKHQRWRLLTRSLESNSGAKAVFWMIALRKEEFNLTTLAVAVQTYEQIRARVGDEVTIFVAGQPRHEEIGGLSVCDETGRLEYARSWQLARRLAESTKIDVRLGPELEPEITFAESENLDGCHQGPALAQEHAQVLMDWFDPETGSAWQ